ncbi:conserved hypothetical protein [Vibrio chagasii]|nr:conserved hypothetical protein [Vibrio chagasii]
MSIGKAIESCGWLQGKIISKDNAQEILKNATFIDVEFSELADKHFDLIVVTQSCNLANEAVPTVQLAIAHHIGTRDKQKEYNKHPRDFDMYYSFAEGEGEESTTMVQNIRINILEKVFVHKSYLLSTAFNSQALIGDLELRSFVDWLGCHYTKPALPTEFNNQIDAVRRKNTKKFRKKEKGLSADFLGIYVLISPDRDIVQGETYSVNMLGLVDPSSDLDGAAECLVDYAELLEAAGMKVKYAARYSTKVSVATLQDYQRLYLDELSYGSGDAPPPDVKPGIR